MDINIAVMTDAGLTTPLLQGVDGKGLSGISSEVREMAGKAQDRKLTPMDMAAGGFTISHLGMFGIKNFCAIINPPQSAILAVGTTDTVVVPSKTGGFEAASMMNVTLSCDHRSVDGATGALWLKAFKGYMENPMSMLL